MGWYSAVYIFDAAIEAAYELQRNTLENHYSSTIDFPNPEIIEFAKVMRDELEPGDWDSQQESDYWEALAPHLWPDRYKERLEDAG